MVWLTDSYDAIFLACIVPYAINIVNFLGYPAYLDGEQRGSKSLDEIQRVLWHSLRESLRHRKVRRILIEAMNFEGTYKSAKDYIQPMIQAAALALPFAFAAGLGEKRKTALLVALVGFALYILSSFASRRAGAVARAAGGEENASRLLWIVDFAAFAAILAGVLAGIPAIAIVAFVALAVLPEPLAANAHQPPRRPHREPQDGHRPQHRVAEQIAFCRCGLPAAGIARRQPPRRHPPLAGGCVWLCDNRGDVVGGGGAGKVARRRIAMARHLDAVIALRILRFVIFATGCYAIMLLCRWRKFFETTMPSERKILVVEDDPKISQLISGTFAENGYVSRVARDGTAALKAVESERFDAVVLDIMLPGIDGYAVLERIRKIDADPCP